jgi:hypothetical protein
VLDIMDGNGDDVGERKAADGQWMKKISFLERGYG